MPATAKSPPASPLLLTCVWRRRTELDPVPEQKFDYHICLGLHDEGGRVFRHFRHQLNPDHFRSPSNDVSGTFGLLGEKQNESRMASFERAIADLVHIYASEALYTCTAPTPVLLIRGPLVPKLRGRLLMTGISTAIRVYVVTSDRAHLESMDLQANLDGSTLDQILSEMNEGDLRGIIPPAGLDKGTRSWYLKRDGGLIHFELIANMNRGELTFEWQEARANEIRSFVTDPSLDILTAEAEDQIESFYSVLPAEKESTERLVDRPVARSLARPGQAEPEPAEAATELVPAEARQLLTVYKPFFSRKEWSEFSQFADRKFWPPLIRAGRLPQATEMLRAHLPKYLEHIDPLKNRIRAERAIRRLERIREAALGG